MAPQIEYQPQASRKRLSADQAEKSQDGASFAPWLVLVVLLIVGGVVWGQVGADAAAGERDDATDETTQERSPAEPPSEEERTYRSELGDDRRAIRDYRFRDNPRELSRRVRLTGIFYSPQGQATSNARINHELLSVGDPVSGDDVREGEFVVDSIRPDVVILRDEQGNHHRLVLRSGVGRAAENYGWDRASIEPWQPPAGDAPQSDALPID